MKAHFTFFAFAFLMLVIRTCPVLSQDDRMVFQRVAPPPGLHPGSKAAVQDAQGYMWIGTYQAPLRRYDGYHYTFYSNDPLDSNSLAENWVEALCAGRNGVIWVGTATHGLDRIDPVTGHFKHYRHNPKDSNSLSNDIVTGILEDHEGMIWIATQKGLNRLDPETGTFRHYFNNSNDPYSLSCNIVAKIYEDKQGTIWVGTGSTWTEPGGETNEGGLNRFEKKTGKFVRYLSNPGDPHSLVNNNVTAIFEDSRGTFWVGTAGDGLHTMDRAKGTFQRHLYDPAHPEKLSRPPQKKIRTSIDDHITFIIEDSSGAIWVGTFGNGLNRYDPGSNKVIYYPLFKDPVTGMQLEVAWWACNSRDGVLWIGYWRGLYRIDALRKNIPYFATGTSVDEIYQDKPGALWYGTDEGLVKKDRNTGIEQRFVYDPNNPHSIRNNRIHAIYEDRESELWIATAKGLDRFDRKTGTIVHHVFNKAIDSILKDHTVQSLYEDKEGSLWLGVSPGLICLKRKENTFTYYRHNPGDTNSLSNGDVLLIYEDRDKNLWVITFGGTLSRLSPRTGKFQRFLNGINIHNLWQDSEGVLWVGTSLGLYRSNASLSGFSRFTGPNDEFGGNMIVNGVLEDDKKNLWINASLGICRLSPERNKVVIFSRHEDPVWYNGTGCYKGNNGEIFFGGGSGYFAFFPEQLTENTKAPQIVLSAIKIDDKPLVQEKPNPLREPLSLTNEIRLKYNQNVFSFDFAGIHFSNPEGNRHLFMLENLDKTWRKAGEEKTAYYYNVPPGHYVFRVKAANSDGIWAEKAVSIIIDPPWWRTWWADLLYALGFVAITLMYTRYRSRKLKAQNIFLEEKVIRRTNELEESLKEKYELSQKLESQQALSNERLRISRELHDDIGSTLGSISIYSEVAKKGTGKNENTKEVLSKIGVASRELIDKMSDIVWSLNPNNEGFGQLQNRMMAFAAMILAPCNIRYDFVGDEQLKQLQLTGVQRKNIFLIFKEALYNIVKYADCKTATITLCVENDDLIMIIQDDGKGFNACPTATPDKFPVGEYLGGNGIKNMNTRADDMNAMLRINSKIKEGTTVQLTIRL